jgi:capsular exopolysaccharide synthesis family protein
MSREIQLANVGGLPIHASDGWSRQSTALGAPMPQQPAPLKKLHRMMRGRYIIAGVAGLILGVVCAIFGYRSTMPLYAGYGFVRIDPTMPNPLSKNDSTIYMYSAYLQSQSTLMTTSRVLENAMSSPLWKETNRGPYSNDASRIQFENSLSVAPIKNQFFIQVQFLDEDPIIAMKAVNAVLDAYRPVSKAEGMNSSEMRIEEMEKKVNSNRAEIARLTQILRETTKEFATDDLKQWHDTQLGEMMKWRSKWMETSVARSLVELNMNNAKSGDGTEAAQLSVDHIKALDPQMRRLVVARDDWDTEMKRLRAKGLGENHVQMRNTKYELQLANDAVEKYADEFRNQYQVMQSAPDGQGGTVLKSLEQLKTEETQYEATYKQAKDEFAKVAEKYMQIKNLDSDISRLREENLEFSKRVEELTVMQRIGSTMQIFEADRPVTYEIDKRKQFAAVGFVGGFGLPFAIFLLIGFLDSRFRYSEEAGTDMSGITLLGILPNLPDLLTDPEQASIAAHCVHQIRTMLQINGGGEDRRVFAVTSASPGDGKTSLTLALGLSFAASGSRTLIIDCDLVGAGLTTRMNMASAEGVLEAIANRSLLEYIRTTDINDLAILPVGSAQAHHASMLSPGALRKLVAEAKKHFEIILIDTGPILGSIEASSVTSSADGVILCVARGQQRPLVEKSLQHLSSIGARLAGVVFNRAQARDFERSVSRMSMRSVPRAQSNGHNYDNGGTAVIPSNRFGPVARAVASSVKPSNGDSNGNGHGHENGHEESNGH